MRCTVLTCVENPLRATNLTVFFIVAIATISTCQSITFNISTSDFDYPANIRKVTTYEYVYLFVDTLINDSLILDSDALLEQNFFNRSGLLYQTIRYNASKERITNRRYYDEVNNLIKTITQKNQSGITSADSFVYDYPNHKVYKFTNPPSIYRAGHGNYLIFKECLKFDSLNRMYEVEYTDSDDHVFRTVKSQFDGQTNNILKGETFEERVLKHYFVYAYDSLGRKQTIKSFDWNGALESISAYQWTDENTCLFEQHYKGEKIFKSKEVKIRDKKGNVVKRYYYELLDSVVTTIYVYDFEYYID